MEQHLARFGEVFALFDCPDCVKGFGMGLGIRHCRFPGNLRNQEAGEGALWLMLFSKKHKAVFAV